MRLYHLGVIQQNKQKHNGEGIWSYDHLIRSQRLYALRQYAVWNSGESKPNIGSTSDYVIMCLFRSEIKIPFIIFLFKNLAYADRYEGIVYKISKSHYLTNVSN